MINFILAAIIVLTGNMGHTTTVTTEWSTTTTVYNYKNEVVYQETTYINDYYEILMTGILNDEYLTGNGEKITYYNDDLEVTAFSEFDSQGNLMHTYYYPRYYGMDSY